MTEMPPPLDKFLFEHRAAKGNLVSMTGGKYNVPPTDVDAFFRACADTDGLRRAALAQRPFGVDGKRRLFFDLDALVAQGALAEKGIDSLEAFGDAWHPGGPCWNLVTTLVHYLLAKLGVDSMWVAVAVSSSAKVKRMLWATGVHVVTNMLMTPKDCRTVYEECVAYMDSAEAEWGELLGGWATVMDKAVFGSQCTNGSGLRMPMTIRGFGPGDDRVYLPRAVFRTGGQVTVWPEYAPNQLRYLSIWPETNDPVRSLRGQKRRGGDAEEAAEEEEWPASQPLQFGPLTRRINSMIMRAWTKLKFPGIPPTGVRIRHAQGIYYIGTKSRFCPYKGKTTELDGGANHSKNHIYITLEPDGLVVRCCNVACKRKKKEAVDVYLPGERDMLFPEA